MATISPIRRRNAAGALLDHVRTWIPAWGLTAALAFLVLFPLTLLFLASFQTAEGGFTLSNYARMFSEKVTWGQIWTTMWLATLRCILATALGVFLAWVVTRTDTPWRGAISFMIWLGYFAPTLPLLLAWVLIAGRVGLLNAGLQHYGLIELPLFDIYSYAGIVWVSTLNLAALVFILIEPAFRAMDASLEEGARMCGASRLSTLLRITIPAVGPAILGAMLYVFVLAVESFEPELLLGTPARIYVLSTRIYALTQEYPQDIAGAATLSTFILTLVTLLIIVQQRILSGRSYVTVTGKGSAARVTPLGRWRWATLAACLTYFLLATALPLTVLILGTFVRGWGIWDWDHVTLDNWAEFFSDPRLVTAIGNTVILGVIVGLVGTVVCALIAYLTLRTRFAGNRLLVFITWAPRTAPAVVVAVAMAWAFISSTPVFVPILGTIWILAVVLLVNTLPVGSRTVTGAMHQIGLELEQAARISGADWLTTMRRVVLPLLAPALMSAFVLLFLLTARNLSLVLFFYTPGSRTLSAVLWEAWSGNSAEQGLVAGVVLMAISCIALGASVVLRNRARQ